MRRTYEEFAAEVHRRGEATIQANKKRRWALLTTLPVAVCLLAVSVALLPELLPVDKTSGTVIHTADDLTADGSSKGAGTIVTDDAATELYDSAITDSFTTSIQSVEVTWTDGEDGQSYLCTDEEAIAALERRLPQEAVEVARQGGSATVTTKGADGDDGVTADKTAQPLYRFTLFGEDGTRYGYALSGSELYVEGAALWLPLTEDEATALQETLRRLLSDE